MEEFARLEQAIVMELESLTDLRNSETARASTLCRLLPHLALSLSSAYKL
jgi:hypothetical protein